MKKIYLSMALSAIVALISCGGHSATEKSSVEETPWDNYFVGEIDFKDLAPDTKGSEIYHHIIPDAPAYITKVARQVLSTLYYSPDDSIPGIKNIEYTLEDMPGVSAKDGCPPDIKIFYSTQHIERAFGANDTAKLDYETKGVLYHELTHAYQLEPQGIGTYSTNKTFWAFIEGMADAVRLANGCFGPEDRPKGGNYMDGYRTAGFFFVWIRDTKDPEFLKKFNRSTLEVVPWSFDAAVKHVLGDEYQIDQLWKEYQIAVGDIEA